MRDITLTINDQKVTVPEGTTVLQAARLLGIDIPTLCHDEELSNPGACRLCIVEIKNMRNGVGSVLIEKFYPQPINCKMYARISQSP